MPEVLKLPKLGETMADATVVEIKVKLGDTVALGDIIYEIETDKATIEIQSPKSGEVAHVFIELGQTIMVDSPVIVLAQKDEVIPDNIIEKLKSQVKLAPKQMINNNYTNGNNVQVPVKEDFPLKSLTLGMSVPVTRLQKIVAEKMVRSKSENPCFYLAVKVDITELVDFRENLARDHNIKISYNDLLIKTIGIALQKFPLMTAKLAGDFIELPNSINVGLAVSVPAGLLVPVVKNVQNKTLSQIASDTFRLIRKARRNNLQLTDIEGACITLSNLGSFSVDSFIPIVVPGQCSILGVGRIVDTCVPSGDEIDIRKFLSLTLSVNHRITNGAYASHFLDYIKKTLEDVSNFP